MTISVTHATTATGTDEGNGEIHKAEWNAGHTVTGAADASHTHSGSDITSGTVAEGRIDSAITRDSEAAAAYSAIGHDHDGTPESKLAQANTHQSPDTDSGTSSLHHTIGTGANQAAAGNHSHGSITSSETFATGATTLTNADTYYDVVSVSLGAGTWLLIAVAYVKINGATGFVEARLWDGSTVYDEGEAYIAAAGGRHSVPLAAVVTLAMTTTVKISCAATVGSSAGSVQPTLGNNGTTNKATKIVAVQIG